MMASGFALSSYIGVSGLTDDELDPKICEDGIPAAKVPDLCKRGDNIGKHGLEWLIFLQADKKVKGR